MYIKLASQMTIINFLIMQDIIVNFLLATGIGIAGILSAYMASLWGRVDDMQQYSAAAELTRVTAAVAVSRP